MKHIKRIVAIFLAVILAAVLAGCQNAQEPAAGGSSETIPNDTVVSQPDNTVSGTDDNNMVNDNTASSGSKVLVVYFSRTGEQYNVGVIDKGNTAIVAEMIAEQTGADMFEILPEKDNYPYTYNELTDVAKKEQNENARPAYAGETPDLSQYDTVYIGAPVWWGDWPMICYTFFETNSDALAGKTLIPFSTHEGSGLSGFDKKLAKALPDSTVGEGLTIKGSDAQNKQDAVRKKVNDWLSELGF